MMKRSTESGRNIDTSWRHTFVDLGRDCRLGPDGSNWPRQTQAGSAMRLQDFQVVPRGLTLNSSPDLPRDRSLKPSGYLGERFRSLPTSMHLGSGTGYLFDQRIRRVAETPSTIFPSKGTPSALTPPRTAPLRALVP